MEEAHKGRTQNKFPRMRALGLAALLALSLVSCNKSVDAESVKLRSCAKSDEFTPWAKATSATPIETRNGHTANVEMGLKTLYRRAINADGEINLPTYKNITEVLADSHGLTLQFPWPNQLGVRQVRFNKASEDAFNTQLGVVACTDNGEVFPNGVAEAIDNYVRATSAYDRIAA